MVRVVEVEVWGGGVWGVWGGGGVVRWGGCKASRRLAVVWSAAIAKGGGRLVTGGGGGAGWCPRVPRAREAAPQAGRAARLVRTERPTGKVVGCLGSQVGRFSGKLW